MASSLTQADVARLLAEPSTAARAEVADKLAREIDSTLLTAAELRIAHDVVRIMAQDAELAVRRALSHSLRSAAQLPHDVALRLASDVEAVALPILINSPVLTDQDLIALVNGGSEPKQEAIAGRPGQAGARDRQHPVDRSRAADRPRRRPHHGSGRRTGGSARPVAEPAQRRAVAARRGAASRQRRRGGGAAHPDQLPGTHRRGPGRPGQRRLRAQAGGDRRPRRSIRAGRRRTGDPGQRDRGRDPDGQRRRTHHGSQHGHRDRPFRRQRPRQDEHGAPGRPAGGGRRAPGRDRVRDAAIVSGQAPRAAGLARDRHRAAEP